jgi:monoterpene epsilon-lactone hydrolase
MFGIRLYFIKRFLYNLKAKARYDNLPGARRAFERGVGKLNKPVRGFTYSTVDIGGISAEFIKAANSAPGKILLYFHGGGYAVGSTNTHRAFCSQLAKTSGTTVLSVNYRLAPENKYPAAIHDGAVVYQWLLKNDYKAKHIALAGDSAGGGVTFGTLAYLRDNNIEMPACAVGFSPWVDLSLSGPSYQTNKDIDCMLILEAFPIWAKAYLGDADPLSPYASPIFHSMAGFPPMLLQVGSEEMLLDDSRSLAAKAKSDGVDVQLEVYPKMFHVFNAFFRILSEANGANKKAGEFIAEKTK